MNRFTRRTAFARLSFLTRARSLVLAVLAVSGVLALRSAAPLLGQGDAGETAPPAALSSSPQQLPDDYQAYPLHNKNAWEVEKLLSRVLGKQNDGTHVVADPRGNRILVRGPVRAQDIARKLIDSIDRPATANTDLTQPASGSLEENHAVVAPGEIRERFVRLDNARNDRVEKLCRDLFGERFRPRATASRDQMEYDFSDGTGRSAEVRFDARQNGVTVRAPEPLLSQFTQLIATFDSPPQGSGRKIRIVPIRRADPRKLRQAVEAYRQGYRAPADSHGGSTAPNSEGGQATRHSGGTIQQSAYQESTSTGATDAGKGAGGDPGRNGLDVARRRLRELGADVEIETLDDLDVIILRGNDRDVEEISKIIREIERLSIETAPAVEVVPLKHVGSEALAELLHKVNADLIGGRQGRITITPLVKPNSLLLIGWGEAVTAVKELIAKLDQPVDADSEFRVFRLKHAQASVAATNLQTFFTGRLGLGARVRVTPDPRTNSLLVQASPRDILEIEKLIARIDAPDSSSVQQARIIKLQHALAADVATTLNSALDAARGGPGAGGASGQKSSILEFLTVDARGQRILKSGVLSDVRITPDPQRNSLVVSAPAESLDLIEALVRQLDDAPTATAQIKVFRVVNGDATALAQMLRALLPSQPGNVGPQLSNATGETSLAPLRFAVDLRTNSIIATGSTGDLRIIEALLLRLDERESQTRKNAVYRLKNAPALDVARAINDFLRSERSVQQAAPGNISPFLQIESEVVVVPEPVSNTLILSATPRFFDEIRDLVERLDAQPPQVMIQVLIAELQLNDADEFGVELGIQDSLLFDRSLLGELVTTTNTTQTSTSSGILTNTNQVIQSATNTPGFNFNGTPLPAHGNSGSEKSLATSSSLAGQALSNFAMNRLNSDLGFGGLVLSASSESVSVLIRALQESRRLEILSRPQVMTLDNQPAFIQVGQRVPRIVGSTINQLGQINTIELENVGLILAVTPRISPDGMVVMEIDAEKSDVGPEAEGIPVSVSNEGNVIRSPRINLTTAQTTVSATSGQTIVLGGLITKSTSQIHRRVPWLGDLPLLGSLFRYDSMLAKRSELLIIMTPHVVRSPDDVERIKQIEAARMHWCCADVHQVHGDGSLCNRPDCPICNSEIPTIYPDLNPRGNSPSNSTPPQHGVNDNHTNTSSPLQQPDKESLNSNGAKDRSPGPYIPEFQETAPPKVEELPDSTDSGSNSAIRQTSHAAQSANTGANSPAKTDLKSTSPNRIAKFPFGWRR